MKNYFSFILFFIAIFFVVPIFGDENPTSDSPRVKKIGTPWGRRVTAENVHPEYPRPTMVRKNWLNLNGHWDYKDAGNPRASAMKHGSYDGKILVPFPVESSLSGVDRPMERVVYRRFFTVPEHWPKDHRVLLHFGAVDWETVVYVNDRYVGIHQGGYDSFSFDITPYLFRPDEGANEIVVQVFDPSNQGQQPRGKQAIDPTGVWYTSCTGIWQTVWLEPVPADYIKTVYFFADLDRGCMKVLPLLENSRNDLVFSVEAFDGNKLVAEAVGPSDQTIIVPFPPKKIRFWSPDDPHLYRVRIRLLDAAPNAEQDVAPMVLDEIGSYCAFREISLIKDDHGQMRIGLNGRILFQAGVIDQGYWPDGIYTPPSDLAVQSDIQTAKSLGFNVIRKQLKVESQRWYYWCDRMGMLVWQDMPNAVNRSREAKQQFRNELRRMVIGLSNHPSIVVWTLFNEGWGQHDTQNYVTMVRGLDSTRLVNNASGWNDCGTGHLNDHHKFPGPEMPTPDVSRASVLGSFGGLTLVPPLDNLWTTETWGFQHVFDSKTLLQRYEEMHRQLEPMILKGGLSGAMFHQLTDIEAECNGLMSYDRVLLKIPTEEFYRINRRTISLGSEATSHEPSLNEPGAVSPVPPPFQTPPVSE